MDAFNATEGDLKDYNCKICKNRGCIAVLVDGVMAMQQCKCVKVRKSIRLMREAGINPDYKLENFKAAADWQKNFLKAAERFLGSQNCWFYAGGQVGSGKTHICTGIVRELLQQGYPARYMLWRDESVKIKAVVNKPDEYAALIEPLKTVEVLYIDDFLKSNPEPTPADLNLAFEIINARCNRKLITIISSEYYLDEVIQIDQSIGSRIYERSIGFQLNITRSKERNYRFKNITRL